MQKLEPRLSALEKAVAGQGAEPLTIEVSYYQDGPDGPEVLVLPRSVQHMVAPDGRPLNILWPVLGGVS